MGNVASNPGWTTPDLWLWIMIALGLAAIVPGLVSKHIPIRDNGTLYRLGRGKIAKKPWRVVETMEQKCRM